MTWLTRKSHLTLMHPNSRNTFRNQSTYHLALSTFIPRHDTIHGLGADAVWNLTLLPIMQSAWLLKFCWMSFAITKNSHLMLSSFIAGRQLRKLTPKSKEASSFLQYQIHAWILWFMVRFSAELSMIHNEEDCPSVCLPACWVQCTSAPLVCSLQIQARSYSIPYVN